MSQTARQARLLASVDGEFAHMSNAEMDSIASGDLLCRQQRAYRKELGEVRWAEFIRKCDEEWRSL